jgi:hypothetical protein
LNSQGLTYVDAPQPLTARATSALQPLTARGASGVDGRAGAASSPRPTSLDVERRTPGRPAADIARTPVAAPATAGSWDKASMRPVGALDFSEAAGSRPSDAANLLDAEGECRCRASCRARVCAD